MKAQYIERMGDMLVYRMGERCTFQEPNMLYENGECHACGKSTEIQVGGFALHYILDKTK